MGWVKKVMGFVLVGRRDYRILMKFFKVFMNMYFIIIKFDFISGYNRYFGIFLD